MRVRAELTPRGPYPDVVALLDVLKAGSAVPLLMARGAGEVLVTASLRLARELPAEIRLAERDGLPPEGFDRGINLDELEELSLAGERVVYVSENLPRALELAAGARVVLLGGLRNARWLVKALVAEARVEMTLIAVGHRGEEALDDALAAGFVAKQLEVRGYEDQNDAARLASALLRAFPDPQEALLLSSAGAELARRGQTEDLARASLISRDPVVPRLAESELRSGRWLYRFLPYVPD